MFVEAREVGGQLEQRETIERGDHIRVGRCCYWHHGIYVNESRVIQFGGGIGDKYNANIDAVTLAEFAHGRAVQVVTHSPRSRIVGPVGPPGVPDEIVHRAEWLLNNHPPNHYNLVGWNCEHLATFCVNGSRESSQVRHVFVVLGSLTLPGAALLTTIRRPPRWHIYLLWSLMVLTLGSLWAYRHYSERFWRDIEDRWSKDYPTAEQ